MSITDIAIGEAYRAKLRALILPRLYVGATIPRSVFLGRLLGCDGGRAAKHMRAVLAEAGIVTERGKSPTGCRVFVVAMPERRAAA